MASKACSLCKTSKDKDSFHKDSSRNDGLYPYCKPCRKEFCKKSYYDNPIRQRERHLKYKYGLTFNNLMDMIDEQQGKCKICTAVLDYTKTCHRNICVDHCHTTGLVRGILCNPCNVLLGQAKDSTQILKLAIKYLTNSERRVEISQAK